MKKNGILVSLLTAVLLVITFSQLFFAAEVTGSAAPARRPVIVIDAGHGDFDPGAVAADGTQEKDLNLSIAQILNDLFVSCGYQTYMTRTGDSLSDVGEGSVASRKRTDTRNRVMAANSFSDAILISIHQNAFEDSSQHGSQVFYGVCREESSILAHSVQASIRSRIQPNNTREVKKGTDSIYILMHCERPVILVECGFITNGEELAQLKDPQYQRQLAWSIFLGCQDYLNRED